MIFLRKGFGSILSLVFPQSCYVCGQEVESISYGVACQRCWYETRLFEDETVSCYKCSYFFGRELGEKVFCQQCSEEPFDLVRCVGLYEKALKKTILHLKKVPSVPKYLQDLIVQTFKKTPFANEKIDLLIPVPISKARLAERGFNQSSILAKPLARSIGLQIDEEVLVRKVHTKRHSPGMDKKARQIAVNNAFSVTSPDKIRGKVILLVDDVFTSGATVSNCAKKLKESGVSKVYVFTIARAFLG